MCEIVRKIAVCVISFLEVIFFWSLKFGQKFMEPPKICLLLHLCFSWPIILWCKFCFYA